MLTPRVVRTRPSALPRSLVARTSTPHPKLRFVGPALRLLRKQRGLRQNELARRASITKAMLSAFERRRRVPALRTLAKVLEALDVDLLDLALSMRRLEHATQNRSLAAPMPAEVARGR